MTTIYGSEGSSVGRSSGKMAERAKQRSLSVEPGAFISKGKPISEPGVQDSECVAGLLGAKPDILANSSTPESPTKRVRKLRAKPIDLERLKADNQRVKEIRERMRRLRENTAD